LFVADLIRRRCSRKFRVPLCALIDRMNGLVRYEKPSIYHQMTESACPSAARRLPNRPFFVAAVRAIRTRKRCAPIARSLSDGRFGDVIDCNRALRSTTYRCCHVDDESLAACRGPSTDRPTDRPIHAASPRCRSITETRSMVTESARVTSAD
jgi:hypothetical protein